MDELTVSISEACRMLGIGRTTLYQLIGSGRLKTIRIGRRRLVVFTSMRMLIARAVTAEQA